MPFNSKGERAKIDSGSLNNVQGQIFKELWKEVCQDVEGGKFVHSRMRQILCGDLPNDEKEINPLYIGVSKELFDRLTYKLKEYKNEGKAIQKAGQTLRIAMGDDLVAMMKGRSERCSDKESIKVWRMQVIGDKLNFV